MLLDAMEAAYSGIVTRPSLLVSAACGLTSMVCHSDAVSAPSPLVSYRPMIFCAYLISFSSSTTGSFEPPLGAAADVVATGVGDGAAVSELGVDELGIDELGIDELAVGVDGLGEGVDATLDALAPDSTAAMHS